MSGDRWKTARYVRHEDISTYLLNGWKIVNDMAGTHHGHHAVIMEFVDEPMDKDSGE